MNASTCPACCSPAANDAFDVPDHEYAVQHVARYSECAECGTLYQHPMPDVNELAAYYPAHYHSFAAKGLIARLKHRTRLKRLASLVRTQTPVVLDFGCGDGAFIREAATQTDGWSFWGFEIAPTLETLVSAEGRVTIVRGQLEDLLKIVPPCDLVTMNHVIEHLPDPLEVLTALYRHMTDAAVLEGQTPAADSFERRVFGRTWSGFHAPRHTVIFSRGGLARALARARFVEAEVTAAFNPAGIAVSLASLSHGNHRGAVRRMGVAWLAFLGAATALYPIDFLSGAPGIINYVAVKACRSGESAS